MAMKAARFADTPSPYTLRPTPYTVVGRYGVHQRLGSRVYDLAFGGVVHSSLRKMVLSGVDRAGCRHQGLGFTAEPRARDMAMKAARFADTASPAPSALPTCDRLRVG